MSSKQNKSHLSLLLDLPLDIRLTLLETVFRISGGVTIIYTRGVSVRGDLSHVIANDHLAFFIPLLRSCRQLHSEIVKILYGRNRFFIATRYTDPKGSQVGYSEAEHSEIWLKGIGRNARLMKHVTVILPDTEWPQYPMVNLLPLVESKWRHQRTPTAPVVAHRTIGNSSPVLEEPPPECIMDFGYRDDNNRSVSLRSPKNPKAPDAQILNNIFNTLVNEYLPVRRYSRHPRLFGQIYIRPLDTLHIVMRSQFIYVSRQYSVLDEGKTFIIHPVPQHNVHTLPKAILERIANFLYGLSNEPSQRPEIEIPPPNPSNPSQIRQLHFSTNPGLTCKALEIWINHFYSSTRFCLKATSTTTRAELPHWDAFVRLMSKTPDIGTKWTVFHINFELPPEVQKNHLPCLVNIKPLLLLGKECWTANGRRFRYTVSIRMSTSGATSHSSGNTSPHLDSSGFHDNAGEGHRHSNIPAIHALYKWQKEDYRRLHLACPDIWVDKDGEVKELTPAATSAIGNGGFDTTLTSVLDLQEYMNLYGHAYRHGW